jgi:pimeloyl-ACP methyl ester carboxylesterase
MTGSFVVCVRDVKDEKFIPEPGPTKYLRVPENEDPSPRHAMDDKVWVEDLLKESSCAVDPITKRPIGDILIFIHGYNNSQTEMMNRHHQLLGDLRSKGYKGSVISYDWPSADVALNYVEDRIDAKTTALRLVTDCILKLSRYQLEDCQINVHILAHSTGAFVVREAFDDADDRRQIASVNWSVSQLALIGADISTSSLEDGNAKSAAMFRHCVRITNYSNPYDSVLKLSNVKRAGTAPRVGRTGLPDNAPKNCVNVNCGDYWSTLDEHTAKFYGAFPHSWHIGDPVFAEDLAQTLSGDVSRGRMSTRKVVDGKIHLVKPEQA